MNIYVGNIPTSMDDNELREMFSKYGHVNSAKVIFDRETGRARGFGFVEMSENIGSKAIDELNGQEFLGKFLVVNEARERTNGGFNNRRRSW